MNKLKKEELLRVDGGGDISYSMLNSLYKVVSFIYEVGEALGSFIRRSSENKMCSL